MPNLERLVINVRKTYLESVAHGTNFYNRPELWPSLYKLAWARSKPKVYIPEDRKAQRWLQALIDGPNNEPSKVALISEDDWATDECPPGMIAEAVAEADERHTDALESLSEVNTPFETLTCDSLLTSVSGKRVMRTSKVCMMSARLAMTSDRKYGDVWRIRCSHSVETRSFVYVLGPASHACTSNP
jgi:hypothetical protein